MTVSDRATCGSASPPVARCCDLLAALRVAGIRLRLLQAETVSLLGGIRAGQLGRALSEFHTQRLAPLGHCLARDAPPVADRQVGFALHSLRKIPVEDRGLRPSTLADWPRNLAGRDAHDHDFAAGLIHHDRVVAEARRAVGAEMELEAVAGEHENSLSRERSTSRLEVVASL